ncbi:cache domain-containing protein [Shewanella surugensis]|uniref:Cache domain-containing protein n=1 Tax=Shewanella surugensis TaxID=212020 RepID=A0ABT0LIB9_9GAMM|nr:cache domain-containing protein [Shewanella surugensis]MCL1127439.1 cache domain-containing protein [Shewanella surugensis]
MKMIKTIQHIYSYIFTCVVILLITACNDSESQSQSGYISEYELNKVIVQVNVVNMATGLKATFNEFIDDDDERIALTQAMVNEARFFDDDSGYFFVETLDDATVIAHIYDSWIGTSRIDAQDLNGKYHVQEMIKTVERIGFGFLSYYFTNPATDEPADKHSFVTGIDVTEWFIAAGVYNDGIANLLDINDANKTQVKQVTQPMAEGLSAVLTDIYTDESSQTDFLKVFIDYIRFFDDQSGYFFILDSSGTVIAHGADDSLEGEDYWNLTDSKGDYFVQGLITTAEENRIVTVAIINIIGRIPQPERMKKKSPLLSPSQIPTTSSPLAFTYIKFLYEYNEKESQYRHSSYLVNSVY